MDRNADQSLDDRLTKLTDRLLAEGGEMTPDTDLNGLDEIVQQLYTTIAPGDGPSSDLKRRTDRLVLQEWNRRQRRRQALPWHRRRSFQIMAVAASLVLMLALVLVLAAGNVMTDLQGAAGGDLDPVGLVLIGVAVLVVAAVWWLFRQRS